MLEKNNFIYVEPGVYFNENGEQTYGVFNDNIRGSVEVAPDLEDFCVTVDLQVEVPRRKFTANSISENEIIKFSFSSGKDKNGKITFFSGAKRTYKDGDNVIESVDLSTAPYECTTLEDLRDKNERGKAKELFGINSIDIEYNNYAVPVVTINFTDIRGIGLFASEEMLRDNLGNIKNDEELSRSFFSCFFQFPYPKFSLMVKGFYGHPVTYELFCADFKANFDSSTGNFNAVAKFVGYSFSLLNDVTINALIAAPLSEYKGAKYWEEQVRANKFVFEDADGNPTDVAIPKLAEFLKKFKEIQYIEKKFNAKDSLELKEIDEAEKEVNDIINSYDVYYEAVKEYYGKNDNFLSNDSARVCCFGKKQENIAHVVYSLGKSFSVNSEFEENEITPSYDIENDYNSDVTNSFLTLKNALIRHNLSIEIAPIFKRYENKKYSLPLQRLTQNMDDDNVLYVFDGNDLLELLNKEKEIIKNKRDNKTKEITKKQDEVVKEKLGFVPNIKNITHMILAHMETLLHCVYECNDSVCGTKRTVSDFYGLDISNGDREKENVLTFPEINKKDIKTGKVENIWLGNFVDSDSAPEIDLVHGLLNGVDTFTKLVNVILEMNESNPSIHTMVTFTDLFIEKNPFTNVNVTDFSDFVGRLAVRMVNVLGTNSLDNDSNKIISEMGKADAMNFYYLNQSPNEEFLTAIKNGTGILTTSDKFFEIASSKSGKNAWNTNDDLGLININNEKFSLSCLPYNQIPFNGFNDWDEFYELVQGNDYKLLLTTLNTNTQSTNLIKIDQDVDFYLKLTENYKQGSELHKRFSVNGLRENYNLFYPTDTVLYTKFQNTNNVQFNNTLEPHSKWYSNKIDIKFSNTIGRAWYNDTYASVDIKTESMNDVKYSKITDFESFTIPQFYGYKVDKRDEVSVDKNLCLFTQSFYYECDAYEKAYLFINLFDINSEETLDKKKYTTNQNISIIPYILVLKYGAYLYMKEKENKNYIVEKVFKQNSYQMFNDMVKVSYHAYRNEFIKWVENEFPIIQTALEMTNLEKFINVAKEAWDELQSLAEMSTTAMYESQYTSKKNVKRPTSVYDMYGKLEAKNVLKCFRGIQNYRTFVVKDGNVILVNNQDSKTIESIKKLIYDKQCVVLKTSDYALENVKNDKFLEVKKAHASTYYTAFIDELNNLYGNLLEYKEKINKTSNIACDMDDELKIAMYKYLKILWDRWLCGDDKKGEKWHLRNFKNNFHFIDSFYCDVSHAVINLLEFVKDLTVGWKQTSHSVLTFLSTVYQKNRFMMFNVQNFANFAKISQNGSEKQQNKLKQKIGQMFKPLAYNDIEDDMIKSTSDIIVLYGNEYSSKLNIPNSDYEDDSFCFTDEITNPTNAINENKYTIPAFGVSYGKQYQHYFKDISVSMDSPVASEQALRARFEIANMHTSTNGENGNHVVPIGADLFTVYSNNSYSCTVKMMGCAWIQPLMYFQLNNIPMFRGAYLIHKVTHHIEPGNMETTIMGMRMSKYSTKIMDKPFIYKNNDDDGGVTSDDYENKENLNASIYNNCEYKFYSPLISYSRGGMSLEDLGSTISEYEEKYKMDFYSKLPIFSKEMTIRELLGDAAYSEARNQGELGIKLVLTVIFNRYCNSNRLLQKVFYNEYQHSLVEHITDNDTREKYNNYVDEIFNKTPMSLVGKQAIVEENIPIFNMGVRTNELTRTKEIELNDLKKINMYCTRRGYNINYNGNQVTEANPQICHNCGYCFQHKDHVFVSENNKISDWGETSNNQYASIKTKTEELIKCIKKTLQYNEYTKHIDIETEITSNDGSVFKITDKKLQDKPSSGLAVVFDVILSTYSDYVSNIWWNVNNNSNELPISLSVFYNIDNTKQCSFLINDISSNGQVIFKSIDKDSCNELFYYALRKKYSDSELKYIKIDCIPFQSIKEDSFLNEIKTIFNSIKLSDCKEGMKNGFNEKGASVGNYVNPWAGTDSERNRYIPLKSNGNLDIEKMTEYAIKHVKSIDETDGECAKYVRLAMTDGGGLTLKNYPKSACRYEAHLPVWGFEQVDTSKGYTPQNGDISVTGAWGSHEHGHIQIYCANHQGKKWISDKAFNSRNGYHEEDDLPNKIFRWPSNKSQA